MRKAQRSTAGIAAVAVVAVLLAVETVRLTTASRFAETRPALASTYAPFVPDSLAGAAMTEVGKAALQGADPSKETLERFRLLATLAPLRPEPFLVEAALAEREGNYARARRLLGLAESRAPRSPAAHYLLADVSIREGKVVEALNEMAILARLVPNAAVQLAPALAQYARTPGAKDELSGILAQNPKLKEPLLAALATDPTNADLIVALAGPPVVPAPLNTRGWQSRLINSLVARGEVEHAYRLWRHFAGLGSGPRPLLYNPDFSAPPAPEPFGWFFSSSGAGLAEAEDGRLRVLYFGRQNARLASQLLLLPPGRYRFDARVSGDVAPASLKWKVACRPESKTIMELEVDKADAVTFSVPAGCNAQLLELDGVLQDMPQNSDVRIGPLRLERAG